MPPTVFWPSALGLIVLLVGLWSYRGNVSAPDVTTGARMRALGPVLIAAALATFSGEHFSDATSLMALVPKWLPLRLAITYFVGVGLLAAGLSLSTKRAVRWSASLLALMFATFVALLYLPSLVRHPGARMAWIFPFREGSFAIGAFCIFVSEMRLRNPDSRSLASLGMTAFPPDSSSPASLGMTAFLRVWTGGVLVFYGTQNVLFPQFKPGVPDPQMTSAWVPQPHIVAYATGAVLMALGVLALFGRTSRQAITGAGAFMAVLALALFGPDLFLVHGAAAEVNAINFVADTLLFAGTLLVIARSAISESTPRAA